MASAIDHTSAIVMELVEGPTLAELESKKLDKLTKRQGSNVTRSASPDSRQARAPTITSPAMMTGVGMLLGTAAYMSPEQARGKAVDKRTDIWAFGCVLYEMLTGTRAFDGDDVADTLANVLKVDPDWARLTEEVPPPIRALVRNSLEKDRRKRVSDAGAIQFRFGACGNICCPTTHRCAALRRGVEASRAGAVDAPI